jgi:hypothetical protein
MPSQAGGVQTVIPLRVREVTNPYPGKSLRHQEGFYTPSILSSLTPLPFVAIWGFSRLYGTFYGGDPTHGF